MIDTDNSCNQTSTFVTFESLSKYICKRKYNKLKYANNKIQNMTFKLNISIFIFFLNSNSFNLSSGRYYNGILSYIFICSMDKHWMTLLVRKNSCTNKFVVMVAIWGRAISCWKIELSARSEVNKIRCQPNGYHSIYIIN